MVLYAENKPLPLDLLNYEKGSNPSGFPTILQYNTKVPFIPKHTHYFVTVRPIDKELTVKTQCSELSYIVV